MSIIRRYPTTTVFVAALLLLTVVVALVKGAALALSILAYFSLAGLAWIGLAILGVTRTHAHSAD